MPNPAVVPVILSGGSGTRLWPVSREATPKPFMKVGTGESLLKRTFDRAAGLANVAEVVTVTNRDYLFRTRDEYGRERKAGTFILEPFGRNTAPAIAMAALHVSEKHGDGAVMVVLPADHLIQDLGAFTANAAEAVKLAATGMLVTFGIQPDHPETGYGYIEMGEALAGGTGHKATRFVEKPYLELAQKYLAAGNYVWNSGMFAFTAGRLLEEFAAHQPQLLEEARACWKASKGGSEVDSSIVEIDGECFGRLADISIDYAVMEKAGNVAVLRAGFDWNDIGSWSAIHQAVTADKAGNSVVGEAVLVDVSNTYIQTDGRLVAAVGLDNVVIVDTPDALLVADRNRSQDVKKVVEQLKLRQHEAVKTHRTVSRPWGTYTVLEEGDGFKIKRIVVKPSQQLSLQMHHHRSEHWVVVSGTAKVTNGEQVMLLRKNESTYIPAGNRHRLENPGLLDLVMIEVQSGDYLGEDDIVRFQDSYGRA
jgi:mannose-1-phosphate guanylyltransferase